MLFTNLHLKTSHCFCLEILVLDLLNSWLRTISEKIGPFKFTEEQLWSVMILHQQKKKNFSRPPNFSPRSLIFYDINV